MAEILFGLGVVKVVTIAWVVVFNPVPNKQEDDPNAQYVEFQHPDDNQGPPNLDVSDRTFDDEDHRRVVSVSITTFTIALSIRLNYLVLVSADIAGPSSKAWTLGICKLLVDRTVSFMLLYSSILQNI
jgi:hypothetical protein